MKLMIEIKDNNIIEWLACLVNDSSNDLETIEAVCEVHIESWYKWCNDPEFRFEAIRKAQNEL